MNNELMRRLELMKASVEAEQLVGPFMAWIPAGLTQVSVSPQLADYADFVRFTDGAHCGEAIYFPVAELDRHQWLVRVFGGTTDEWLVVGRFDLWLIVLHRPTGQTHLTRDGDEPDERESRLKSFARFDDLLGELFGTEYLRLNHGAKDDWFNLLVRIGLANASL